MIFRPPSRFINRYLATGLLFAISTALPISASAQQRVGSTTSPNVVVDYSVLDQLGRTPNVADVLSGRRLAAPAARSPNAPRELQFPVASGRSQNALPSQIRLRPPSAARTGSAARQNPKRLATPKSPKPPATVTARRAAPTTPLRPPPPPSIAEPLKAPTAPSIDSAVPPAPPPVPSLPASAEPQKSPTKSGRESITPPPAPALPSNTASSTGKTLAAVPPPAPSQSQSKLGVGSSLRVDFASGSAKLDPSAETELSRVADALKGDDALRIQLLAYAGADGNSASQARRLSLSRALAARSSLINQGIKSARIDVRALGDKAAGGPPDRIDIIVTKR